MRRAVRSLFIAGELFLLASLCTSLLGAPAMGTSCGGYYFAEGFDSVTPPSLPSGWSASNAVNPDGFLWVTSNTLPATPPNHALINDLAVVSDKRLDTPIFTVPWWLQ